MNIQILHTIRCSYTTPALQLRSFHWRYSRIGKAIMVLEISLAFGWLYYICLGDENCWLDGTRSVYTHAQPQTQWIHSEFIMAMPKQTQINQRQTQQRWYHMMSFFFPTKFIYILNLFSFFLVLFFFVVLLSSFIFCWSFFRRHVSHHPRILYSIKRSIFSCICIYYIHSDMYILL